MASLGDLTAGTRTSIGRYFSVVSMIPSVLLVLYLFILIRSGAWSGHPDWSVGIKDLAEVGVGGAAAIIATSIAVGFAFHPLQFSMVQFFEGYWGTSSVAQLARAARIRYHRDRADALEDAATEGDAEAARLVESYPDASERNLVMPTRLGNVLRRHEAAVGRQYGLQVLVVLPHMALVGKPEEVRYLDDQRAQLDLSVRLCFTALLACAASALFLWQAGPWLFVALIPFGFAYLSYRGAVVSAHEFGQAMATLVDLGRFDLYERMHLPMPDDIEEERDQNTRLMQILEANSARVPLDYQDPQRPVSDAP